MGFPNIQQFQKGEVGRCEREMGIIIAHLLRLVSIRVVDPETNSHVLELARTPERWSAGHSLFDEIRRRNLEHIRDGDERRDRQYAFEESCCKVMYNATNPTDPFDSRTAFFVAANAVRLAEVLGVPMEDVVVVLAGQ